jgi:hypothetical protein
MFIAFLMMLLIPIHYLLLGVLCVQGKPYLMIVVGMILGLA